jgi:hypothetical protein
VIQKAYFPHTKVLHFGVWRAICYSLRQTVETVRIGRNLEGAENMRRRRRQDAAQRKQGGDMMQKLSLVPVFPDCAQGIRRKRSLS